MSERAKEFAHVEVSGKMDRNVIEVKGEQDRHARRLPPTRLGGWASRTVLVATGHGEQVTT
jgi:hypothetical protein